MLYEVKGGRRVNIPDDEIRKNMRLLGLSQREAVQMWLEDEGFEHNAEQEALEKKAKENRITATIHKAKNPDKAKRERKVTPKVDAPKEKIIAVLAESLQALTDEVTVTNKAKYIDFVLNGEHFTVNLIRHTKDKKKEG